MPNITVVVDGLLRTYAQEELLFPTLMRELNISENSYIELRLDGRDVCRGHASSGTWRSLQRYVITPQRQVEVRTRPNPLGPEVQQDQYFPMHPLMSLRMHPVYARSDPLPATFGTQSIDAFDSAYRSGLTVVIGGGLPDFPHPDSTAQTWVCERSRIVGQVAGGPNLQARIQEWWNTTRSRWLQLPEIQDLVLALDMQHVESMFLADQKQELEAVTRGLEHAGEVLSSSRDNRTRLGTRLSVLQTQMRQPAEKNTQMVEGVLASILAMPKVLDLALHGNTLCIRTTRLICLHAEDEDPRDIGAFVINIELNSRESGSRIVTWRNITRLHADSDHPHIRSGRACLGSMSEIITSLMKQISGLPAVVAMAIQYAESANTSDVWGESLSHWPVVGTDRALSARGRAGYTLHTTIGTIRNGND